MNIENIQKLKEMLPSVTAAPWISYVEGRDFTSGSSFIKTGDKNYSIDFIELKEIDQDFIALCRNEVPFLIDELDRLRDILNKHQINY